VKEMTDSERQPKFSRRNFLKAAGLFAATTLLGVRVLEKEKLGETGDLNEVVGPSVLPRISPEERVAIEKDYMVLAGEINRSPFYVDEYGIATWGWIIDDKYEPSPWASRDGVCLRGERERPWATEDIKMKDGKIIHVIFEYPEGTSLKNGKPIREKSNGEQDSPDVKIYDAYSNLCSGDGDYFVEREYDFIEGPNGEKTYYVVEHGKCDRRLHDGLHRAVRVWFVENEQEAIASCVATSG
jgi:hypothetical protein